MKKIAVIVLMMFTISAFGQEYGKSIEPTAEFGLKLKQASDKVISITCDFTQTKRMAVLAKENVSKGKFYYKRVNNICLEYSLPEGNCIVMNDEKFKITNLGKTNIVSNKSNPMMRQMSSMLSACMVGDLNVFGKESVATYYESEKAYTVIVTPTNKRAKNYMKEIVLCFDKKDMTLLSMRICENDTDFTFYEFKNKVLNSTIPDTKFVI